MEYIWQSINHFALTHDGRKVFLIIYMGGAAFIALVCGLFYFAIWVAAHFALEVYKYYRISSGLRFKDILLAIYHCKLDIMFLSIGLCIDVVSHHSLALATANQEVRFLRILRFNNLESLGRIAKVSKLLPRLFGTIKASSCVLHLTSELSNEPQKHTEDKSFSSIQWKPGDTIIASIILVSFVLTFVIPMSMGQELSEVIHSLGEILSP